MKRLFILTTLAVVATSPAWADGTCSTAPAAKFQPQANLEALLQADGLTVRQIKVEKGCYEVYATDKNGKKINLAYNAETLEKLANPEAGEN